MKIAHITPFFAPAWSYGGPVRVCFDLARAQFRLGNRVTVLTTDAYDHTRRIDKVCEVMDKVKVYRFRNLSNRLAKRFNLYLPIGFARYFKKHARYFDIVHLHSFFTYQNVVCSRYCKKYKVPYVLHLHEMPIPLPLFKKTLIKKIFNFIFGKKILYGASKIFVSSQMEKKRLHRFMPELDAKVEIVLNPVVFSKNKAAGSHREKFGLKKKDKVFLFVGRLSFIKGLDRLILAFAHLAKKDASYKLVIAGPDEGERSKLEKSIAKLKISKNVIFTGFVEGGEKEQLYALSDVFVLFSYYEAFAIVVLEAIAHSLPVCLSEEVGVAGEIESFGCGKILRNAENSKRCATGLKWVYDNKERLAKNCKPALSQFSQAKITNQIISIYCQVIKST